MYRIYLTKTLIFSNNKNDFLQFLRVIGVLDLKLLPVCFIEDNTYIMGELRYLTHIHTPTLAALNRANMPSCCSLHPPAYYKFSMRLLKSRSISDCPFDIFETCVSSLSKGTLDIMKSLRNVPKDEEWIVLIHRDMPSQSFDIN